MHQKQRKPATPFEKNKKDPQKEEEEVLPLASLLVIAGVIEIGRSEGTNVWVEKNTKQEAPLEISTVHLL